MLKIESLKDGVKISEINNDCPIDRITEVSMEKLIKIKITIGFGTKENPVREITQYWDQNGNLLFTNYDNNILNSIRMDKLFYIINFYYIK